MLVLFIVHHLCGDGLRPAKRCIGFGCRVGTAVASQTSRSAKARPRDHHDSRPIDVAVCCTKSSSHARLYESHCETESLRQYVSAQLEGAKKLE
jgi:hypothetical protein